MTAYKHRDYAAAMQRLLGLLLLGFPLSVATAGCAGAGAPACVETNAMFPESIVLDHTAAPPENQTSYGIGVKALQGNCAVPAHLAGVTNLSVSDPVHVQIGSNGYLATAICVGSTDGPVTVSSGTLTAQLTCK